jgi:hypothetical protein
MDKVQKHNSFNVFQLFMIVFCITHTMQVVTVVEFHLDGTWLKSCSQKSSLGIFVPFSYFVYVNAGIPRDGGWAWG